MLHVYTGDSTAHTARTAQIPGEHLAWREALVCGPAPADMTALVPEKSRGAGGPLRLCPECGRLYWPGGHVRRMLARLGEWNSR